jgi:ribosome-associated protein
MSDRPSKSARKRQHQALQALGEQLIELTESELDRVPLDEDLRDAIVAARGMTSRGALRRQRQLIGKLMARTDAGPIREAYDALKSTGRDEKAIFRRAEQWRDRLLHEGQSAARELAAATGGDVEGFSALLGEYARAHDDDGRRRVARRIFRAVHAALAAGMQKGSS